MNIYCFSTLSFAKLQFKSVINKAFHKHGVASFTDAWIETVLRQLQALGNTVASFTDAWIETPLMYSRLEIEAVASFTDAWIETVKIDGVSYTRSVASFTDAWIETHVVPISLFAVSRSHLLQMRGLKLVLLTSVDMLSAVASFTDAWIETIWLTIIAIIIKSHLLQMRGLKHTPVVQSQSAFCRIFYRCVD